MGPAVVWPTEGGLAIKSITTTRTAITTITTTTSGHQPR